MTNTASLVTKSSGSDIKDKTEELKKRVKEIAKRLNDGNLPGILLDANFVEEKVGDGVLGPPDHYRFYALSVPVAAIPAWRAALKNSRVAPGAGDYAAPKKAVSWWLKKEEFEKAERLGPAPLTGRDLGWVVILPNGRIYIYSMII